MHPLLTLSIANVGSQLVNRVFQPAIQGNNPVSPTSFGEVLHDVTQVEMAERVQSAVRALGANPAVQGYLSQLPEGAPVSLEVSITGEMTLTSPGSQSFALTPGTREHAEAQMIHRLESLSHVALHGAAPAPHGGLLASWSLSVQRAA